MTSGMKVTNLNAPHSEAITAIRWPVLETIYTAAMDHYIYGYDIIRQTVNISFTAPRTVQCFDVRESGVAVGMESGQISLFDMRTQKISTSFMSSHWVRCIAIEESGRIVTGNDGGAVQIWDTRSSTALSTTDVHSDKVL
jgi:WD40 repeat protein